MKIIINIFLITLVLTSCEDFLDVKPIGKLIPKTVEEFEYLLNHRDMHFYDWSSRFACPIAELTDNYEYSATKLDHENQLSNVWLDPVLAYTFNYPYVNPESDDAFWDYGIYRPAYNYNNIIEGIENIVDKDADKAVRVTAQALAGRALLYLRAGYVYGPAYKPGGANDAKSIPYRTASSITVVNPDLLTTQELFDRAEADLLKALEDIPNDVIGVTRFDRLATRASLAYLYMLKGDFPNMLTYADDAWSEALAKEGIADDMFYDYNKLQYAA